MMESAEVRSSIIIMKSLTDVAAAAAAAAATKYADNDIQPTHLPSYVAAQPARAVSLSVS